MNTLLDPRPEPALRRVLAGPADTVAMGASLGRIFLTLRQGAGEAALVLGLHGSLGAGKSTLARGMLRGIGHHGTVKSPTYTLVEPYEVAGVSVHHFDLYRIADAQDLEFIGARDYFSYSDLCIIEWAERGEGALPRADLDLELQFVDGGRSLTVRANTQIGNQWVRAIA